MSQKLIEIAKIRFRGPLYEAHALDTAALKEIVNLQEILYKSIEVNNLREHNVKRKLTKEEKESFRIFIGNIDHGSAITTIQTKRDDRQDFLGMAPTHETLSRCMHSIYKIVAAAESNKQFPQDTNREIFTSLKSFGNSLSNNCILEVSLPEEQWVPLTSKSRKRFDSAIVAPYSDTVKIRGHVLEADVKFRRFTIWPSDDSKVKVKFSEAQESLITTALKDHKSIELHLTGDGKFDSAGQLTKIYAISDMRLLRTNESTLDAGAEPIWEKIARLTEDVPDEFFEKYPADISTNHDSYLRGVQSSKE